MTRMRVFLGLWGLVAIGVGSCSTYTAIENAYTDVVTVIDGPLPEAQALETVPLDALACCAADGVRQFEIGRRYELGVGGLPLRSDCAAYWYGIAGRARTTVIQRNTYAGTTGPITYLGMPQARVAARRLEAASGAKTSGTAPAGCLVEGGVRLR